MSRKFTNIEILQSNSEPMEIVYGDDGVGRDQDVIYNEHSLYIEVTRDRTEAEYWLKKVKQEGIPFRYVKCDTTLHSPLRYIRGYSIFIKSNDIDLNELNNENGGDEE